MREKRSGLRDGFRELLRSSLIWRCRAMPVTPSGKEEAKTVRQWVAEENDALERFA